MHQWGERPIVYGMSEQSVEPLDAGEKIYEVVTIPVEHKGDMSFTPEIRALMLAQPLNVVKRLEFEVVSSLR